MTITETRPVRVDTLPDFDEQLVLAEFARLAADMVSAMVELRDMARDHRQCRTWSETIAVLEVRNPGPWTLPVSHGGATAIWSDDPWGVPELSIEAFAEGLCDDGMVEFTDDLAVDLADAFGGHLRAAMAGEGLL